MPSRGFSDLRAVVAAENQKVRLAKCGHRRRSSNGSAGKIGNSFPTNAGRESICISQPVARRLSV